VRLQIFDVEHGAGSLLTADNNMRLIIDCGHNATTGWKPGSYLLRQGIRNLEMLTTLCDRRIAFDLNPDRGGRAHDTR
jgi:hypothetical protein